MLGIQCKRIESNSVGYKMDYQMHSLDFEEFLWAKGYDGAFINELLEHMQNVKPLGEALVKCGYDLYYYKREDSTLEEDFFVRTASELIPVEVKAVGGGRAKSLHTLIASEKYSDISHGIKFTAGNIGYKDKIYTFPYFCAFLLKRYLKKW